MGSLLPVALAAALASATIAPAQQSSPAAVSTEAPATLHLAPGAGIFFDITADADISIHEIEFFAGADAGAQCFAQLWIHADSYAGREPGTGNWILHENISFTAGQPTTVLRLGEPLALGAGSSIGIHLLVSDGGLWSAGSADARPLAYYGNEHLSIFSDVARTAAGTIDTPHAFAGTLHYTLEQPACYANCDQSADAPLLDADDVMCFLKQFALGQALPHEEQVRHYANCDSSTSEPALNIDDLTCFISAMARGCP